MENPSAELLYAELERLFELDELKSLSADLLGIDPESIGGASATASFARALTDSCFEKNAVEALCDAIVASKTDVDPDVARIRLVGASGTDEPAPGETVGAFSLTAKIGSGRLGTVFRAQRGGGEFRVKVLHRHSTLDRRGVQRFLTANRLIGGVDHGGLPIGIEAGEADGRCYVAQLGSDAEPLSDRLAKDGAQPLTELMPTLRGILSTLAALHDRRLAHGDLHAGNVLVSDAGDVTLVDGGTNHLRVLSPAANGQPERISTLGSPSAAAPEQIEGALADARSDLYCFGALLHQALAGKPLFPAKSGIEVLVAHLMRHPPPVSVSAPPGTVPIGMDDFLFELLDKDPARRPKDAAAVLEKLEELAEAPLARETVISQEEIQERIDALVANPYEEAPMDALESAVAEGAEPTPVAEAFQWISAQLEPSDNPMVRQAKARMLFRAGKLFEKFVGEKESAETLYDNATTLDPSLADAPAALERVRRALGKYEDVVEMLLARSEQAPDPSARSKELAAIGKLYATELDDAEQALVAYSQAFCEDPLQANYVQEIERLAGKSQDSWGEVLTACVEQASNDALPLGQKNELLTQMGRWYLEKVGRMDLALPCLQAVVGTEPTHDGALETMAALYRKAQQWRELGMVLTARADAPNTPPAKAREIRVESAELLEIHLGDPASAKAIYEQVLSEDPSHAKANEALAKLYEREGNVQGYLQVLERRAQSASGDDKNRVLCELAELYEEHADDPAEATKRYEEVIQRDPNNLEALRGLDRVYSRVGRYPDLVQVLEKQAELAVTARQKITLFERIAGVYDEEFLDHQKAAVTWENVLQLEPSHDQAMAEAARHYRAINHWGEVVTLLERRLEIASDDERRVSIGLALGDALGNQLCIVERAIDAYEAVLVIAPGNETALEALASLRASAGDSEAALDAIEKLAKEALDPATQAGHWVRAAEILEARGEPDAAIERLKLAAEANPEDRAMTLRLRDAYARRGDFKAAVDLLDRELERTPRGPSRAKLAGEVARLCLLHLEDRERAEAAAKSAIDDDSSNLDALTVLADLAFDAGRHLEAGRYYEQVTGRIDSVEKHERIRLLDRYLTSLLQLGEKDRTIPIADLLLSIDAEDRTVLARASTAYFEHGPARRAFELCWDYWHRFEPELDDAERAQAKYRLGEAARRSGDGTGAIEHLEEAVRLDPASSLPLQSMVKVYEDQGAWEQVVQTMFRQLETLLGDERHSLLIRIGDLAAEKLRDPSYAAKSYLSALSERPDDRKIMMKLMQLYSAEKDWKKLIKVILKLAQFVDDPKQKAKYLHTASQVAWKEMGDRDQAAELLDQVVGIDSRLPNVLEEALTLNRERRDAERLKVLLKERIKHASEAEDKPTMLACMDELADVYIRYFNRLDQAIAVNEGALELAPDDEARRAKLAELYSRDPIAYANKAIDAYYALLRSDPYRLEVYKNLRKIYTELKRPDCAWCVCQALYAMNRSDPDEAMFYKRMRTGQPAAPRERLGDRDWLGLVMHPGADTSLTVIFAIIQATIIAGRAKKATEFGYEEDHRLFGDRDPYMMVRSLEYACDIMEMEVPPLYQNTNDTGGLSFLHATTPGIVLGRAALDVADMTQDVAFVAARQLAYFRPGMYVRHLVPTGTGLKAWLFAAVSLVVPKFPIPLELSGQVEEAKGQLARRLTPQQREHLTRAATKLIDKGALDLKRWVAAVDLTADRAGLVFSDDLQTAVKLMRAMSGDDVSSVSLDDRLREIYLYSVSGEYLALRERLGLAVA